MVTLSKKWFQLIIGIGTGLINGLIGVGGTLLVPALVHFIQVPRKIAHGSSIAIILPTSLISIFIYKNHLQIPLNEILPLMLGGMVGGFIGAKLLKRFSNRWLKRLFSILMVVAGIRMLLS
ncbi:sulfite exporter TauE/SafE family protein [Microaerobacter geothermalis]|uniref:sulfite exporter TauE/SafE family protein n=1 Tax=Microaerobacter geothermalis TaxID=674972 RepID=UPI001F3A3214|nr:sulfite exporter TauE/SafE family protein [Microaerobacter geothermalis]MCF6092624.1 sulfite exporter TauE/SafE family protein [Microaerobacter geothermalis]